jgi:hypothetical protein
MGEKALWKVLIFSQKRETTSFIGCQKNMWFVSPRIYRITGHLGAKACYAWHGRQFMLGQAACH